MRQFISVALSCILLAPLALAASLSPEHRPWPSLQGVLLVGPTLGDLLGRHPPLAKTRWPDG